jgi:hypothetical protein
MKRRNFIIRWQANLNDWILDRPDGISRATSSFLFSILWQRPHKMDNSPMPPIEVLGGLLDPATLAELEKRGIDTKKIRIILPVKVT